jgi:hypothetical protein
MSRNDDPIGYNSQSETGATTSSRPPQYKNCGFRCGEGCGEPLGGDDEGGGSDCDSTPTLVGDDNDQEVYPEALHNEFDEIHSVQVDEGTGVEEDPIIIVDASEEMVYFSRDATSRYNQSAPSQSNQSNSRSPSSLENHAPSEPRSSAASEVGRFDHVSHLETLAGLDDPFSYIPPNRRPPQHYFLGTPLRLSPRYEDCRGHPASHGIVQDYSMLLDVIGDSWTPWIPGNGNDL